MFRNPLIDAIVVVIVALIVFGPKRLPMLGRALGQGLREFKEGITGESKSAEDEERPALTQATPTDPPSGSPASPSPVPSQAESAEAGTSSERRA